MSKMMDASLAEMTRSRRPKFGHYVGEFVTPGIGHILAEDSSDMEAKCDEVLAQIALCAPGANAVTKSIVFEAIRRPRPEALDFAAKGFASCMLSEEGREGVTAFIEKRKPKWANE